MPQCPQAIRCWVQRATPRVSALTHTLGYGEVLRGSGGLSSTHPAHIDLQAYQSPPKTSQGFPMPADTPTGARPMASTSSVSLCFSHLDPDITGSSSSASGGGTRPLSLGTSALGALALCSGQTPALFFRRPPSWAWALWPPARCFTAGSSKEIVTGVSRVDLIWKN